MTSLMTKKSTSSVNKEEALANMKDSTREGKEEMAEALKVTNIRAGGGRVCGAGRKILDSHRLEAQRPTELEAPSEAIATIQMPKVR
jgi:hypothetical protein